jgi:signal transduction histidine kinase/CheY-like chemotaxis protein
MCLLPVALVDRFNAMNKQKERMQELSYQSQKLESISLLASGIGHDFNNILMSIAGYTRLAITFASHHDKHRVVSSLEKIQRSVVRAVSVVDKLLIFAQERTISTDHPICARQIVNEIVHIIDVLRSSICSTIAIDVQHSLKNDFPSVLIEPSDIHQLIINLVLNARDSIEDKRPLKPNDCLIKINVSIEKVSKETCSACNQTIQGEFLMINVEDTGMGIIPEKIPHLFEPFFTSKGKGKGMGLGLSVVNGIMHSAYGHIGISTLAEVGSVFTLYLPTHPSMASKNDAVVDHLKPQWVAAPLQDDVLNHSVTICVIDDDPDICDVLSQELRLIGYRVQSFSSSLQAWQYLKGNMNEIDVMITDYGMPEMSGLELANNVLTEKPLMPIIIFTGYSDRLQNKNDLPKGNTFLFKKPLNVQVLVQTIQQFFKVT